MQSRYVDRLLEVQLQSTDDKEVLLQEQLVFHAIESGEEYIPPDSDGPNNTESGSDVMINIGNDYTPTPFVVGMHWTPRFGHTNHIGKLASKNPKDAYDYEEGIKQFTLFVTVPFVLWGAFLVFLKWKYGIERAGCAAGGDVVDIAKLRREGIRRKKRQRRMFRSFRLQTTFLFSSLLIPIGTGFLARRGFKNMEITWGEVEEISDSVEAVAYRAFGVIVGLDAARLELHNLSSDFPFLDMKASGGERSWCPVLDFRGVPDAGKGIEELDQSMKEMRRQVFDVLSVLEAHVQGEHQGLQKIIDTTQHIDKNVSWSLDKDWIIKFVIMMFNVTNLILFLACHILTKQNIKHKPSRFYLSYFVVPMFMVLTAVILFAVASIGVATVTTADFCAGGEGIGSPRGAIVDAILAHEFGSLDRNHTSRSIYREAFEYYANQCLSKPPLGFLEDFRLEVNSAADSVNFLAIHVGANDTSIVTSLTEICGANMTGFPNTLNELGQHLQDVAGKIAELIDITSCQNISPIIRRITFGGLCDECISGMTWSWWIMLAMCIVSFVMITTRAALYNPIISRPKRNRPANIEKEFTEYKAFMLQYYQDAAEWNLRTEKKKTLEDEDSQGIVPVATFETEASDEFAGADGNFGRNSIGDEPASADENDGGSCYSSESDFDDNDVDDEDIKSMISSLVTESTSSVKHAMQQMKSFGRSLLGSLAEDNEPESPDGLFHNNQFSTVTKQSLSGRYRITNGIDFYRKPSFSTPDSPRTKRRTNSGQLMPRDESMALAPRKNRRNVRRTQSSSLRSDGEEPMHPMQLHMSPLSKTNHKSPLPEPLRQAQQQSQFQPRRQPSRRLCDIEIGIGPTIAMMQARYSSSVSASQNTTAMNRATSYQSYAGPNRTQPTIAMMQARYPISDLASQNNTAMNRSVPYRPYTDPNRTHHSTHQSASSRSRYNTNTNTNSRERSTSEF